MSMTNHASKTTLLFSALTLVCAALYTTPAGGDPVGEFHAFYQNAGATCHGATAIDQSRLTRTENRLINLTNFDVDVVCNLPTDASAALGNNDGVVLYVALWARRYAGTNKTISCILYEGFYGEAGAGAYAPDGLGNPIPLPNSGAQAIAEWTPSAPNRFLGPVNIRCTLKPYTELNDWFVKYEFTDDL
jgi:hypothetical protein